MTERNTPIALGTGSLSLALLLMSICSLPAHAQVQVHRQAGEIVIENAGFQAQRAVRAAGKSTEESDWVVMDEAGNSYEACSSLCYDSNGQLVACKGYQSGSSDPALVEGYQAALDYLVAQHGATVEHDAELDVDLVGFPEQADPIDYFFTVITTEMLDGRFLVDYFRSIEIPNQGDFDPANAAAEPTDPQFSFPNDPFYGQQWNLEVTRLAKAQWHSARAKKPVRIAIIDSGIGEGDQSHEGLDGTPVVHRPVAVTSGLPSFHALGIVSLLGDGAQDGDGIVGLLGAAWDDYEGYPNPPLLASRPPEIYSYNVGDFGPNTLDVARAIRQSIEDGVDIINLSVALGSSPAVEEAVREALRRQIIVVAAAGNYPEDAAAKPTKFPASVDGVISVGAGTRDGTFAGLSANEGVDILAPGEDIIVGGAKGAWYRVGGTSYAAPHVVAALAIMRTVRPELKADDALAALQQSAQAGAGGAVGFLNALDALNALLPPPHRVSDDEILFPHQYSDGASDKAFAEVSAETLPGAIELVGNYPNPFNPATTIRFALPQAQHVRVAVFNLLGQEVRVLADGLFEEGTHDLRFQAEDLPSGIYTARLEAEQSTVYRNMVLMK